MQRAARRHSAATGWEQSYKGSAGVTATFRHEFFDGKQWVATPEAGIIFLTESCLTTEVICHEATHMAVGIYERDMLGPVAQPTEATTTDGEWVEALFAEMPREEVFCYLVSDLTREILERV